MRTDDLFPAGLDSDLRMSVQVPAMALALDGVRAGATVLSACTGATVTCSRGVPSGFALTFADADGAVARQLRPGTRVEVSLGYGGDVTPVVVGEVRSVAVDYADDAAPSLRVEGYDALHALTRSSARSTYGSGGPASAMSDDEVVRSMGRRAGLSVRAESTGERTRARVQAGVTDYRFLQLLAAANGFEVGVDDSGAVTFGRGGDETTPALRLTWGRNLTSFSARRSQVGAVGAVEVRGWDPQAKTVVVGRSSGAGTGEVLVLDDVDVASSAEATALADALMEERTRAGLTAEGVLPGRADLTVGRRLQVAGVGDFAGSYVVTALTHHYSDAGFTTSFSAEQVPATGAGGRGSGSTAENPPGPARTVPGVVPALATSEEDPEGLGRVQVRLPLLGDEVTMWARLAAPGAGPSRGLLQVPRDGDEVLVAFEQGDVSRPYVLGSLWSQQDPPPTTDGDVREHAVLQTAAGHRLEAVDSDGARSLRLLDADGNGLSIDTEEGTVTLHARTRLVLDVPDGTVTVRGSTVEVHASAKAAVSSDGSGEVTASGDLTVRGAMVRIN